ncbi:DNA polymerase III subunit delta [Halalkalibaculum sp. DA3122]|uniref:DNA polymerase III subunit delta n=1 Tax=unclassified Halalkalibaculum TaxID=2964617 RepID=UPI0037545452
MAKKTSIEKFRDALQALKSDDRKPVYFFCGEEEFFLDRLEKATESLVPETNRDFNFDLLYGRDITPEKLLSVIRSYPMMAEYRVVVLRDFGNLGTATASSDGRGGTVNDLLPYLENPNPTTLLVIFDSKKPHGRTKIGKAIQKNKNVGFYQFKEIPDWRLPDWIIEWTQREHSKKISPGAAQMLAQFVGQNLQLVSTEIDKVCTFVDTSENIDESDVKEIIGLYREYGAIELKDALLSRDLEQSLFIAEQMLQHSKTDTGEIIRTVGFFYSVFSNVWQIRRLAAKGNTKAEIQEAMGVSNSWYFNKLWQDASKYELRDMPRVFEALLDADRAAKGFTSVDPTTILLLLIKRIIN